MQSLYEPSVPACPLAMLVRSQPWTPPVPEPQGNVFMVPPRYIVLEGCERRFGCGE